MYACVYPMARGTGDLFAVPQWYVLGKDPLAISCDGTTFANTGRDGSLLLIGIPPQDFAPSGYRLDPFMLKRAINVAAELGAGQTLFDQPAWSVDSVGWVVLARNNYAEPPEPDKKLSPVSSDIVLFDVVLLRTMASGPVWTSPPMSPAPSSGPWGSGRSSPRSIRWATIAARRR